MMSHIVDSCPLAGSLSRLHSLGNDAPDNDNICFVLYVHCIDMFHVSVSCCMFPTIAPPIGPIMCLVGR